MLLHFQIENFRLHAALRVHRKDPRGPVALVDEGGLVAQVNCAAQAREVLPGMTMARALARCGALQVLHPCSQAERSARRVLWNALWQITPQIEMGRGAACGSATAQLVRPDPDKIAVAVRRLLGRLQRCGLPARAGMAATPEWAAFAAIAAERGQFKMLPSSTRVRELLAHLPLAVLEGLDRDSCAVLEGWGIRSLAALAALPRQALGERLGAAGLRAWDVLNGRSQRVLQVREIEPDYCEVVELEDPVGDLASLMHLLQRGSEALQLQLEQSGKMARAVSITLQLDPKGTYHKTIRLPEATRRSNLLLRLLRNHLEPIRLGGGVVGLRLSVEPVDPHTRQAGLFESSIRNPWRLQETLDQLAGLVGDEAFGVPRCRDTHRPDAYELLPLPTNPGEPVRQVPHQRRGPPLMGPPLRRFRPPCQASVRMDKARPVYVQSRPATGAVSGVNGPYRLSGDWAGKVPWALCEWDVEIEGAGLFRLAKDQACWCVLGAYD